MRIRSFSVTEAQVWHSSGDRACIGWRMTGDFLNLFTITQVAELQVASIRTARRSIAHRIGHSVRISEADLAAPMSANTVHSMVIGSSSTGSYAQDDAERIACGINRQTVALEDAA
jgi:hypothetical protein